MNERMNERNKSNKRVEEVTMGELSATRCSFVHLTPSKLMAASTQLKRLLRRSVLLRQRPWKAPVTARSWSGDSWNEPLVKLDVGISAVLAPGGGLVSRIAFGIMLDVVGVLKNCNSNNRP